MIGGVVGDGSHSQTLAATCGDLGPLIFYPRKRDRGEEIDQVDGFLVYGRRAPLPKAEADGSVPWLIIRCTAAT